MFRMGSNFDNRKRYLNASFPEDKAMLNRTVHEWIRIAQGNNHKYLAGDEDVNRFWFRDIMRYLRRKLRTDGQIWFPEGTLFCKVWFEPHKKG